MAKAKRKKTGGRQRGTPNYATREVKAFAESLITRKKYVDGLKRRFDSGRVSDKLQILMWHYAKGQPVKTVELIGKVTLEEIVAGRTGDKKP